MNPQARAPSTTATSSSETALSIPALTDDWNLLRSFLTVYDAGRRGDPLGAAPEVRQLTGSTAWQLGTADALPGRIVPSRLRLSGRQ